MPDKPLTIHKLVAEASKNCEFFRRKRGRALFRRPKGGGDVERLVEGRWIRAFRWSSFESARLRKMSEGDLRNHVRRYIISSLTEDALTWGEPMRRLKRTTLGRWLIPVPKGGTVRRGLDHDAVERSRTSYEKILRGVEGDDLTEMKEQALLGFEHQRERGSGVEQRANFFLGAAGLTTTLVLTNASFLIGKDKLDEPWRALAAVALIVASVCAVVSGVRALQAAMLTFSRTPPNAVTRVLRRRDKEGDALHRTYLASVFVGQGRASVVGDWKIARLGQARTWFLGVVLGAVGLSLCILFRSFSLTKVLVPEVPVLREDHRDASALAGLDHLGVAFGAAGLDHRGGACLDRQLGPVGEGEEGV
jgi:hypothetical protein